MASYLKKLELLSAVPRAATPRATLKHLSCSPNFPRTSYLDERTLTYEPIVNDARRRPCRSYLIFNGDSIAFNCCDRVLAPAGK